MMRVEPVVAIAAALILVSASPVHAQAFADVKHALTDYASAPLLPRKNCEAMTGSVARISWRFTPHRLPGTPRYRHIAA